MGKASERRLNKEKLLFLVALAALAGAAFFLLETRPEELAEASPITRTPTPGAYPSRPAVTVPSEPAEARRTPFMPVPDPIIVVDDDEKGDGTNVTGGGNGRDGGRVTKREPPRPLREPVLGLEYVGLATACGQTRGLLRDAKGALMRVRVGEVLEHLGCTVAAIGDQSIVLRTKTGRIYELRNTRFPKLASNEAPLRDSQRQ